MQPGVKILRNKYFPNPLRIPFSVLYKIAGLYTFWRTTLFVADFHSSYEQAVKLLYGRRFDVGNTVDLMNACRKEVNYITVNLHVLDLPYFH